MRSRRPIEIKGSALPVLRVVVHDCDAQSLKEEIDGALANARPLLAEAVAVLDLRERNHSEIASEEVVRAVRDAGVHLAAVLIADGGERSRLADSGLPIIEAPIVANERPARAVSAEATPPEASQVVEAQQTPQGPPAPICLTRPLRSGRRFYAQGRDLVVLAPASRGSELIADGSIYAFSPLRGRVLAGASGDTNARIIATQFDAELVAVAGIYRTLEAADVAALGSSAVSVALTFDEEGVERLVLAPV